VTPPVLGLIGAIGGGKSTAAAHLAARGGHVLDADRIGHVVLDEPAIQARLAALWGGRVIVDGRTSRKAVSEIVFNDPAARTSLETLMFPAIEARCRVEIASSAAPFIVLDAAVMLEAGWTLYDKLLYIDAPYSIRLLRVQSRGWNAADLAAREAAQWPAEKKRSVASAVIVNDGTRAQYQQSLDRQLAEWGWI